MCELSEYVNVIFIKYLHWLLFSPWKTNKHCNFLKKKKRQEKYLLHYSFLKNVVSKLCVFSPNHKISYSGSNLGDGGKFLSSSGDRSAYLKGMPFSLFYFLFVLFLALTGLGIVF